MPALQLGPHATPQFKTLVSVHVTKGYETELDRDNTSNAPPAILQAMTATLVGTSAHKRIYTSQ